MDERKQYWQQEKDNWYPEKQHAMLELRATMAWELVRSWGSIAGVFLDREDSARRAVMELQTPGALVTRCFAIADSFVNRAEIRGEIRPFTEKEKQLVGTNNAPYSVKETTKALDDLKDAVKKA